MSTPPADNEQETGPFDQDVAVRRRNRAAAEFAAHDFLFREVASRLAERLDDIKRVFPLAVDLGARSGLLRPQLAGRAGIETLVEIEPAARLADTDGALSLIAAPDFLPLAPGSVDLVLSNLALHGINDLPGALIQARRALRPDGLFLATLFGGETLRELRACLLDAELETLGGVSPRVAPFLDVRDAGGLLQRAGLALPVADRETITVSYPDAFALMTELRGMGESNPLAARRRSFTPRGLFLRMAELYTERHAAADGRIPATFEILTLTGWAPAGSQQKPLRPGSAKASLADALDTHASEFDAD